MTALTPDDEGPSSSGSTTGLVALVGAAGKTGRAVHGALVAAGLPEHRLRPLVRRPTSDLPHAVPVDLLDQGSVMHALRDVEVVHHLAPNVHPGELAMAQHVAAAAREQGVRRVVFHSVLRPGIEAMPHHWAKLRAEEVLWSSGVSTTVLQPSAYAQNFLPGVRAGALRVPYSLDAPFSLVDLADVAEATASVILDDRYAEGTYELCGPPATVRGLAEQLGLPAERIDVTDWAATSAQGLPSYAVEALRAMFTWYDRHGLLGNPETLRSLLGREPRSAAAALGDQHETDGGRSASAR